MLPIPHNAFEPLASNSWRVRLNYWILTHFSHVRRWLIIGLVTASVLLYGWAAWRALPIIKDPHLVSRIADQIQNMKPFIPTPPQQLEVSEVSEASHERGVDLLATITNPNDDRYATEVRYSFELADGTQTPEQSTWLLPNETRFATAYAPAQASAGSSELKILGLRWHKVTQSQALPSVAVRAKDVSLEAGVGGQPTRAVFSLQNDDSIGYRMVHVTAVVRSSGQLSAVGTLDVQNLAAGEARPTTLTWYDPLPLSSQVEVQVLVDPFDRANVLLPA
jgi:hypothetical protein